MTFLGWHSRKQFLLITHSYQTRNIIHSPKKKNYSSSCVTMSIRKSLRKNIRNQANVIYCVCFFTFIHWVTDIRHHSRYNNTHCVLLSSWMSVVAIYGWAIWNLQRYPCLTHQYQYTLLTVSSGSLSLIHC